MECKAQNHACPALLPYVDAVSVKARKAPNEALYALSFRWLSRVRPQAVVAASLEAIILRPNSPRHVSRCHPTRLLFDHLVGAGEQRPQLARREFLQSD